jgi:tetratricopeptide (TPR) repeat protein
MKPKRLKNFLKYLSLILLFAGCASTPNAVNSALEAYRNGDFKTAVRMYAIAENEGDDFASNHIQEIIDAYLGSLQYRKLINYCANIIKQEDIGSGSFRKTVAYTYQGLSYYFLGDRKRALENYDNALRIDPGNFEAQGYRGDIDIPIDAYSAYMMGDIYRRKAVSAARFPGDIDKALVNYTGAIELYPAFTGAYIRRGALYAAAKEYDKALVDFESAVNANPDQDLLAATYNDMGVVYLQMGDLARAASCYELSINAKRDYITGTAMRTNTASLFFRMMCSLIQD